MALTVGELSAFLNLEDRGFDTGLARAEGKMRGTGGMLVKAAAAAALGIGAAFTGAAVAGVKTWMDFGKGMNEVFTLMPGISQAAMDEMKADVRDFSKEWGVLTHEAIPALYQSLSAGVPPDNVFDFMEQAHKAAEGGVTDLTTAVDALSTVVNGYGDQIAGAGEASDLMFTAVRLGKTTFDEMAGSLSNVTPIASANKVAFGDVTAAIATLTSQGVPTAEATTQIRRALAELSDAGTEAGGVFEDVAGVSFRQFMEEGGNLADALALMEQAAAESGVTVDQMFGSIEAGGLALALSGDNADKFRKNIEEMEASAGATDAAFERMQDGVGDSLDKLKAAGQDLLLELGDRLGPYFRQFTEWLVSIMPMVADVVVGAFDTISGAIQVLSGLWERWGGQIRAIGDLIAGWVQTVVGLFSGMKSDTVGEMSELQLFFQEIWLSIQDIVDAALSAIQTAVTVFTTVVSGFWERFGTHIMAFASRAWARVQTIIRSALDVILTTFRLFVAIFTGDWSSAWELAKRLVSSAWRLITTLIAQSMDFVKTILGAGMAAISQAWSFAWNAIKTALKAAWRNIIDAMRDAVSGMLEFVRSIPGKITDALGNLGSLLWDAGTDVVEGLWNGIKSMGGWLVDKISSWVADVLPGPVAKVLGLASPSRLFAEYGEDVVRGLMQGIDGKKRELQGTARSMASMLRAGAEPVFGGASLAYAGTTLSGATINIGTINQNREGDVTAEIDRSVRESRLVSAGRKPA